MNFCPQCGTKLVRKQLNDNEKMMCPACNFIDWDTWMNVSVAIVAYNQNAEFAMVRMKSQQAGTLTFPQGYRELGETLDEAAKREYKEETGYDIENLHLTTIYTSDAQRLVWVAYKAQLGAGEFIPNEETSEFLFFSKASPPPLDNLRGHLTRRLLEEIMEE